MSDIKIKAAMPEAIGSRLNSFCTITGIKPPPNKEAQHAIIGFIRDDLGDYYLNELEAGLKAWSKGSFSKPARRSQIDGHFIAQILKQVRENTKLVKNPAPVPEGRRLEAPAFNWKEGVAGVGERVYFSLVASAGERERLRGQVDSRPVKLYSWIFLQAYVVPLESAGLLDPATDRKVVEIKRRLREFLKAPDDDAVLGMSMKISVDDCARVCSWIYEGIRKYGLREWQNQIKAS